MRVFVTGATGFIGSEIVQDLLRAGHQVLGLTRSEEGAKSLVAAGAQVHRGHLEDLESLRRGAAEADGVIHTAFLHDFSKFKENCEIDQRAIEAIGRVLAGTNRPLVVTSGIPGGNPGHVTTEDDTPPAHGAMPRVSEQTASGFVGRCVRVSVIRLPQVHDRDKQGLVSYLIAIAREKGISAYVEDGQNRWPAVHRLDTAPLYRLALEKGVTGASYHAVAEEGVRVREIAEAIGRGLKIPTMALSREEAAGHFGWLAFFAGMDAPTSSALTQERLGWRPTQMAGMIEDLRDASAFGG
jgi:nucleoside-diphosphate-sugar epimerase